MLSRRLDSLVQAMESKVTPVEDPLVKSAIAVTLGLGVVKLLEATVQGIRGNDAEVPKNVKKGLVLVAAAFFVSLMPGRARAITNMVQSQPETSTRQAEMGRN